MRRLLALAFASLWIAQPALPQTHCLAQGGGPKAVRQCEEAYLHAIEMLQLYHEKHGLIDENGQYDIAEDLRQSFRWQSLLGVKSPGQVSADCMYAHSPGITTLLKNFDTFAEGVDFPAIWTCIKKHDPEASRLEAI